MCGYLALYPEFILAVVDAIGLASWLNWPEATDHHRLLFPINLLLDLTFCMLQICPEAVFMYSSTCLHVYFDPEL